MSNYLYGIDVSHWSGKLNYVTLLACGYGKCKQIPAFNYIKASEGRLYKDNMYSYHLVESHRVGLLTGAYHYYREVFDPVAQGRLFASIYNDNGGTDLPPCVDVEVINNPYLSPAKVLECILTIQDYTGRKPIIYTGYYVWRDKMWGAAWGREYLLWMADYTPPINIPLPWVGWTLYQFSDSKGDENWFNGTLADLKLMCQDKFVQPISQAKAASIVQVMRQKFRQFKKRFKNRSDRRPG